jgi:hypothetical protein
VKIRLAGRVGRRMRMLMSTVIRFSSRTLPVKLALPSAMAHDILPIRGFRHSVLKVRYLRRYSHCYRKPASALAFGER